MKKSFLLGLALMISVAGFSNSKYSVDDSKVEAAFAQSVAVSPDFQLNNTMGVEKIQADKNPWVAVVLAVPGLIGWTGVHRVYLGTPVGIIAGYIFTCGGIFGILPLIDCIVLIIDNEDISAYIDKKGLIMFN